jgi:succinate-semialdehyde dehydrogenase/glutarate-semialdehyde dehydrogenase
MVYINWLTDTAPELPFGGVKRSGSAASFPISGLKSL